MCSKPPQVVNKGELAVLFWKRQKPADIIKDVVSIRANRLGSSRRATSMIPLAASGSNHEIAHTSAVRFHQLLISLEGNQRTGCLRIISPRRKARSAILIYRGRVVGCLYGCKKLDYQFLQEDAHKAALADLASPGNILDAYELPDELVLAAASLFNGHVIDVDQRGGAEAGFEFALRQIAETKLPGCIVVNTYEDDMVCMAYVFDGKIIGVFSARDGWVRPTYEQAMSCVRASRGQTRVMASYLPVRDPVQASTLGFSLTGLADTTQRSWQQQQRAAVESFTTIRTESSTYTNLEPMYAGNTALASERPRLEIARLAASPNSNVSAIKSHNVFLIAP